MQCWKQARALAARGHEVTVLTPWMKAGSARWEMDKGVRIGRLGFVWPFMAYRREKMRYFRPRSSLPDSGGGERLEPGQAVSLPANGGRWRKPMVWLSNGSFLLDVAGWIHCHRIHADVVHVHMSGWLAGYGHWLAENMQAPVFCKEATFPVVVREKDEQVHVPWKSSWLARSLKCRFIAITEAIAEGLKAAGIPPESIVSIPNGVELPSTVAKPQENGDCVYVGNFTQGDAFKGFEVLFQAWGKAVHIEPGMRMRVFGAGDMRPWEAYAWSQGCKDTVSFEGVSHDIGIPLRESGFFVLPSKREGLSNALLEAMAYGLPSIVSGIPGNRAAIRDRQEGLVVPPGDVESLVSAFLGMYRDAEMRQRMGRAARQRVEEEFAMGKVVVRLEDAYQHAIREFRVGHQS